MEGFTPHANALRICRFFGIIVVILNHESKWLLFSNAINSIPNLQSTVKYISKLEFEKDVINELMEMFDVKQKGIDQVTKKKELKSTNPLKVNKKKKEVIITLYPLMVCL